MQNSSGWQNVTDVDEQTHRLKWRFVHHPLNDTNGHPSTSPHPLSLPGGRAGCAYPQERSMLQWLQ